jgi:hypothetical protein
MCTPLPHTSTLTLSSLSGETLTGRRTPYQKPWRSSAVAALLPTMGCPNVPTTAAAGAVARTAAAATTERTDWAEPEALVSTHRLTMLAHHRMCAEPYRCRFSTMSALASPPPIQIAAMP